MARSASGAVVEGNGRSTARSAHCNRVAASPYDRAGDQLHWHTPCVARHGLMVHGQTVGQAKKVERIHVCFPAAGGAFHLDRGARVEVSNTLFINNTVRDKRSIQLQHACQFASTTQSYPAK